jgi:hypothetical protein
VEEMGKKYKRMKKGDKGMKRVKERKKEGEGLRQCSANVFTCITPEFVKDT